MISLRRSRLISMGQLQVELPSELGHVEFDLVLVAVERQDLVAVHVEQALDAGDEAVQAGGGDLGGVREGGGGHDAAAPHRARQGPSDELILGGVAADQFLLILVHLGLEEPVDPLGTTFAFGGFGLLGLVPEVVEEGRAAVFGDSPIGQTAAPRP